MANKLWGGRFSKKTHPLVEEFTKSIDFDYKLAEYDLMGSMAHAQILKNCGYLNADEASKLLKELDSIYESVKSKSFKPDLKNEDIHTNVQNILEKKLGNIALKLHTARSRNEQVVFSTKLYCKAELNKVGAQAGNLIKSIGNLAQKNKNIIIPGFTHLQHAQVVYLKDYLLSYAEMLKRDAERMDCIDKNLKFTMGAGALAGTPIDAKNYKIKIKDINIEVTKNSLDAVSDRDFVIEIINALCIIAMHLSRLSEDLIIWSTKEFDFVEIDEAFCTGSSLMPQKKNPDCLELIRGNTGRLYGNLISVLTMMKGLPLTYNRDMQLDKEPLFNSFEIVSKELKILSELIKTLKFNEDKIKEHLKDESLYAADLAYYLVDKKVPFKEAHTIVGKLIKHSIDNNIEIKNMPESALKKFSDKFVKREIVKLFDPKVSVESKKSIERDQMKPKLTE